MSVRQRIVRFGAIGMVLAGLLLLGVGCGGGDETTAATSGSGSSNGGSSVGGDGSDATVTRRDAVPRRGTGEPVAPKAPPIPDLDAQSLAQAEAWLDALDSRIVDEVDAAVQGLADLGYGVVPLLIKHYRDEDEHRRYHVVRLLGQIGHPSALRSLRDALKDPRIGVRIAAAESLIPILRIDDETTSTELLSSIKNDPEPIVKAYSAKTLLTIGNTMGLRALVENLGKRLWPREISHNILKEFSGEDFGFDPYAPESERRGPIEKWNQWYRTHTPHHEKLVENLGVYKFLFSVMASDDLIALGRDASPTLIKGLLEPNEHVRAHCSEILGLIGETDAVGPLTDRLSDENPMVRMEAAVALGRVTDTNDSLRAVQAKANEALAESVGDADRDVRAAAIVSLAQRMDPGLAKTAAERAVSEDLIERARLLSLFVSGAPAQDGRLETAGQLLESGSPLALPWLAPDGELRPGAQRVLQSVAPEVASQLQKEGGLGKVMIDRSAAVLERVDDIKTALQVLDGRPGLTSWARGVVPALLALLDQPESTEHQRFLVVELLGLIGEGAAAEKLGRHITDDPSMMVREASGRALELIGNPAAGAALERALVDKERYVRLAAVKALRTCGTNTVMQSLMQAREANITDTEIVDELGNAVRSVPDRAASAE